MNNEFMLKRILLTGLYLMGFLPILYSQYFANISDSRKYDRTSVHITNSSYADLDVEIGENLYSEDFTVGFTNDPYEADVIISNRTEGNWEVYTTSSSYADISIRIKDRMSYEDISIEIKSSGYVDYLIYYDLEEVSIDYVVIGLLPIINSELDDSDRLEDVPFYNKEDSTTGVSSSIWGREVTRSAIVGDFEGWEGETVFVFENGDIWQQDSYDYEYHYAYNPEVVIYEKNGKYYLKVEDIDSIIEVIKIR